MKSDWIIYGMVYAGSLIMLVNIILYLRFEKNIKGFWGWEEGQSFSLRLPILLLVLFLFGYLAVGLLGEPDLIVGGILFGGSVFVFAILRLMQRLTDRIRQDEELKIALKAAQQASVSKSLFLSNMSHDIRTPLNAIIGYASLAKSRELSPEEARDYLDKIGRSGQALLDLINDILEMSRIESGKMELEEEPGSLTEVFDAVQDMFAGQMQEKRLDFQVDTSGIRDRYAVFDRLRLSRILLNLVSNAYKFTPAGGRVRVSIVQEDAGKSPQTAGTGMREPKGEEPACSSGQSASYRIQVSDTGIGMTPEFASRVFESFERERTSTVSGIQGTGLGMAITKSIVDLMKGRIDVRTAPGQGTTFTVYLPLTVCNPPAAPAAVQERAEDVCRCGEGRRVLLAEDVAINREIGRLMLEQMGLCVEEAANGREAVEMLAASEKGYFDAVLMDIQMPVMDGYEAARRIRRLSAPYPAGIPVIAVTANAFAEDKQLAMEAGMDGHIAKPLDPAALRRVLASLLARPAESDVNDEDMQAAGKV